MDRLLAILRARPVRIALTVIMTAVLAALLVGTIFWSHFDLQWIAFLGGVLFAAVLAMASQASKAEWLVMRRTAQLERTRELLAKETARSRNATEAMQMLESRIQLVSNALSSLILFVDRDQRCRFHNRAVEQKTGLRREKISGQLLRDVVGNAVYAHIDSHVADTLAGKRADYELLWESPRGKSLKYAVRHVPYPPDSAQTIGYYLLATAAMHTPVPDPAPSGRQPVRAAGGIPAGTAETGDAVYVKSMADELTGWEDPCASLVRALEEDQFLLFAQKIQPLKAESPDPACYEILLRLKEEEENMLPPGNFIPIAERYGLMEQLDRWVVRTLIAWCMAKRKRSPSWPVPLFCVNLSESAVTNPSFAQFVLGELGCSGFSPCPLCFEIAEQDIISHNDEVRRFIAALKPAGCRFTVDSFGSIKVSFSHLKGLPIDFIKIDGAITHDITRDATELAKVRAINTVCQKIGVRAIAEFVETQEILDKLREIGVDYVQGYGIARPGPIDKVS